VKVSFAIPAFNEESTLGQCLTSVLAEIKRSGAEAEVVVVNNASTDRTKEVAEGFAGVRVVDEPQKGLTFARQKGLVATSGELLANIDADTVMPPGWLTRVLREFEQNPHLVALSGPHNYYELSIFKRLLVKIFYALGYLLYLFNHYVIQKGAMLQGGNFILRRDAFLKVGGFDTSIIFYGEDTDVACRMTTVGKVKWTWALPIQASARRLTAEGIVATSWRYTLNHLAIIFTKRPASTHYNDIRPG